MSIWGYDGTEYREECDVKGGAWVLVKRTVPVNKLERPQVYGIYWAEAAPDKYKRQKVRIYTPYEVCLLNHEYTVISEERLEEYKEWGYFLNDYGIDKTEPLNLELISSGRSLCEEEREIIWALMLDGLTEQKACEEYYYTHHTESENRGCCYLPTKEILAEIESIFGKK